MTLCGKNLQTVIEAHICEPHGKLRNPGMTRVRLKSLITRGLVMHTTISHTSYTTKNGYVWRKRFKNSTLSIMLKTRDHNEALKNATLMSMKFLEYTSTPGVTPESIKILLTSYRDILVTSSKMAALQATLNSLNVDVTNPAFAIPAVAQVAAVELTKAQAAVEANPRHTFEEAKTVYIESNPTWRGKTKTQFIAAATRHSLGTEPR